MPEIPVATPLSVDRAKIASPVVNVKELTKYYRRADGKQVTAINGTSLTIKNGEFLVLLGPSGCGKTTLLRCIAGLERPDAGQIEIYGNLVYSSDKKCFVPPENRKVSMVFQSYALWPHMNAFANVAYPLHSNKLYGRKEIDQRVNEALEAVRVKEVANQYPHQMSGGQQQRVALARALVAGSALLLFDEPLSNVDAKVREQLRIEMLAMQKELGFASVYVTHDQTEAMQLADRIAVIRSGGIVQLGTPRELYEQPATRYVANFIGSCNEVEGKIISIAQGCVVVDTEIGKVKAGVTGGHFSIGDRVTVFWRPEHSRLLARGPSTETNAFTGTVEASLFLGPYTECVLRVGNKIFRHWTTDSELWAHGANTILEVSPSRISVLPFEEN